MPYVNAAPEPEYLIYFQGNTLVCDAWAIDDEAYLAVNQPGPHLVMASFQGTRREVQQALSSIRARRNATIVGPTKSTWTPNCSTSYLNPDQAPQVKLNSVPDAHHVTVLAGESRHYDPAVAAIGALEVPYYLFPATDAELPTALGNTLRRLTHLLCPPQWDAELAEICRRAGLLQPLRCHNIQGWKIYNRADSIQRTISQMVQTGKLSLPPTV